jgi:acyl dehydratase
MVSPEKVEFNQLFVGFEFPSQSYTFDSSVVSKYLEATRESNELYLGTGLLPPMLVAAYSMAALSKSISMPPGTIHVTQEFDFLSPVHVGDTITCCSKVSRKQDRGGLHLMNTDISVTNQNQTKVLTGRIGFILPENDLKVI